MGRGDIRHYFARDQVNTEALKDDRYDKWCVERMNIQRKQAENAPFNDALKNRCMAMSLWRNVNSKQMD